jgi:hypothetical protein
MADGRSPRLGQVLLRAGGASLRCPTAVDEDAGAVHERGGRRGQEQHRSGDIDWRPGSRNGNASDHLLDELGPIELGRVHRRTDEARCRRVHGHAEGTPLEREHFREQPDAFEDLMRAYESAASGVDDKEAARLSERLGVSECMNPEPTLGLSEEALARCGSRGSPVTLQELVDVAREHGVTLDIQEETCRKAEGEKVPGFDSDATNAGRGGPDVPEERRLREGHVLCDVSDASLAAKVQVTKYATDTETYIRAANVECAIYPHSTAQEAAQVSRLKDALEDVADLAAKRP